MFTVYFDENTFLFGTRNLSYDDNLNAYGTLCFFVLSGQKLVQNKAKYFGLTLTR